MKREDNDYKRILSRNELWLGKVVFKLDGAAFAIPHFKNALDGFKCTHGLRCSYTAETLEGLVVAYYNLGRYDLMLELAKELASRDEALFGADDPVSQRSREHVRIALAKMVNAVSPEVDSEEAGEIV